jgi:hypothetical protein
VACNRKPPLQRSHHHTLDVAAWWRLQINGPGYQYNLMPGIECCLSQCITHAATAGVGEVTHIVKVFTSWAGSNQNFHEWDRTKNA